MLLTGFIDFLKQSWLFITLGIIALIAIIVLALLIINLTHNNKSFKEKLNTRKASQVSITIDTIDRYVEKYYLFDTSHQKEKISLDEFYLCFDKENIDRLTSWLDHIAKVEDFNKTRRQVFIMYEDNKRVYYRAELESYDADLKRYYFTFTNITKQPLAFIKAKERDDVNFFKLPTVDYLITKGNERLDVSDDYSNNYLIAIKCKEHQFIAKESSDTQTLFVYKMYMELKEKVKLENDFLICYTDSGAFLLYVSNITKINRFKRNLKSSLMSLSGKHNLGLTEDKTNQTMENFLEYYITYVAGYTKVQKGENITIDKVFEAEFALDSVLRKPITPFSDRIQMYDEHLKNSNETIKQNYVDAEQILNNDLYRIDYVPIIEVKNKDVIGYNIAISIPKSTKIQLEYNEFIDILKHRTLRNVFYKKILAKTLEHKDAFKLPFYLSFDFDDIDKVYEAYKQTEKCNKVQFYFCLSFSNKTLQSYDLIDVEKKIDSFQEEKFKFGINYNNLNPLYLNAKINSRTKVCLLSGQLIEHCLDSFKNESLLDVYTQLAKSYSQDIVALNIDSLALYEMLIHYKVKKISGNVLTNYVVDDKIADKALLKKISIIEERKY